MLKEHKAHWNLTQMQGEVWTMCTHTFDISVSQGDFIAHICKNEPKRISSLQAYWFSTSKVPNKYLRVDLNQYILPTVLCT